MRRNVVTNQITLGNECKPETVYLPHLFPEIPFSPVRTSLDQFEKDVMTLLHGVRDSLMAQARELHQQLESQGWARVSSQRRDVESLKVQLERLYRFRVERRSIGTIAAQFSPKAAKSTVQMQVSRLMSDLGISPREPA